MAFWQLEPFGCQADDHRAELGLRLLYAVNSKPGTSIPRFIDRDPQPEPDQTPQQLDDKIKSFFTGNTVLVEVSEDTDEPSIAAPPAK